MVIKIDILFVNYSFWMSLSVKTFSYNKALVMALKNYFVIIDKFRRENDSN